jgi:type IV pilus assembly protein PilE
MTHQSGYTLMELMVVVGIVAILASVATPAYINYKNRAIQTEAVEALLRAKMDQEVFWTDNARYANTIGALATFGNSNSIANYRTSPRGYTITMTAANTNNFTALASKVFYAGVNADTLAITEASTVPRIANTDALKFSLFKWLFD